jgi:hypothetical protein
LSHSANTFFWQMGSFEIESCKLIAWGWLWTPILLISASWVTRITGVVHQLLAICFSWNKEFRCSVVEHLLSMHEALCLIPSNTNRNLVEGLIKDQSKHQGDQKHNKNLGPYLTLTLCFTKTR